MRNTATYGVATAALLLSMTTGVYAAKVPAAPSAHRTARVAQAPAAHRTTKVARATASRRTARVSRTVRRPAPPLSFLRENSYSRDEFIAQISGNHKLLMRYANHFHIPPEQVVPYFRQNLMESYIPKTRRYRVWMKRPDGSTYYAYQTFRAGERVLALRNGEPVLKWACGNPLSNRLPEIKKRKVVERTKKVLPNVEKRTRYYNVEIPFEQPVPPQRLAGVPAPYMAPPSSMSRIVTRELIPVASRRFPAAALLPLAFVPHGGSTPPPPPIPEPSTALLAMSGLVGIMIVARTRRA